MLFLSKGMVIRQSTEQMLLVTRCGTDYILTGTGARLWLSGRFDVHESTNNHEDKHLEKLRELDLVELSEETLPAAAYLLLSRCTICPAKLKPIRVPLTIFESQVMRWITEAGLRLTIGELVKLFHDGIELSPDLLGKDNAQNLTQRLYASDLIFNSTFDIQMEHSARRDQVVDAILGLLRKKRIILI